MRPPGAGHGLHGRAAFQALTAQDSQSHSVRLAGCVLTGPCSRGRRFLLRRVSELRYTASRSIFPKKLWSKSKDDLNLGERK